MGDRIGPEYPADKIDLLIQEGLVSGPTNGYSFSYQHLQQLDNIRKVASSGYTLECDRHTSYVVDQFTSR
jgi:hypothetical protein